MGTRNKGWTVCQGLHCFVAKLRRIHRKIFSIRLEAMGKLYGLATILAYAEWNGKSVWCCSSCKLWQILRRKHTSGKCSPWNIRIHERPCPKKRSGNVELYRIIQYYKPRTEYKQNVTLVSVCFVMLRCKRNTVFPIRRLLAELYGRRRLD